MKLLGIVAGGLGIAGALIGGLIVGIAREVLSQDIVSDIPDETDAERRARVLDEWLHYYDTWSDEALEEE